MNIIVDLCIPNSRPHLLWYATAWILAYRREYPEDDLTWVGFERTLYSENILSIPHTLFPMRKSWYSRWKFGQYITGSKANLYLSFSGEPITPASMPTIKMIEGLSTFLLPDSRVKIPHKNASYIVPTLTKQRELVERFSLDEKFIHIIPPIIFDAEAPSDYRHILARHNITLPFFIHDMGWGAETQIMKLITYWKQYDPPCQLVLLGETNKQYTKIRDMIRQESVWGKVKIVGLVGEEEIRVFYSQALGWIFLGYYYATEPSLMRAIGYKLPLILSDIEDFKDISARKINPKRLHLPHDLLENLIKGEYVTGNKVKLMQAYKELFEKTGKSRINS